MRRLSLILVLTAGLGAASAAQAASPTDARSCAIRFRALETVLGYMIDKPDAQAKSRQFGVRSKEVLVKAGLLKAGQEIPKDISDDTAAYVRAWQSGATSDEVLAGDLGACEKANGYSSIL